MRVIHLLRQILNLLLGMATKADVQAVRAEVAALRTEQQKGFAELKDLILNPPDDNGQAVNLGFTAGQVEEQP